jgi:hypothetical protein
MRKSGLGFNRKEEPRPRGQHTRRRKNLHPRSSGLTDAQWDGAIAEFVRRNRSRM